MRVIVDTSIWIEFFKAHDPYFSELKQLIEEQQAIAVECVFGELLQGSKNQRERKMIIEPTFMDLLRHYFYLIGLIQLYKRLV